MGFVCAGPSGGGLAGLGGCLSGVSVALLLLYEVLGLWLRVTSFRVLAKDGIAAL
jgi:hypothetical protein